MILLRGPEVIHEGTKTHVAMVSSTLPLARERNVRTIIQAYADIGFTVSEDQIKEVPDADRNTLHGYSGTPLSGNSY